MSHCLVIMSRFLWQSPAAFYWKTLYDFQEKLMCNLWRAARLDMQAAKSQEESRSMTPYYLFICRAWSRLALRTWLSVTFDQLNPCSSNPMFPLQQRPTLCDCDLWLTSCCVLMLTRSLCKVSPPVVYCKSGRNSPVRSSAPFQNQQHICFTVTLLHFLEFYLLYMTHDSCF